MSPAGPQRHKKITGYLQIRGNAKRWGYIREFYVDKYVIKQKVIPNIKNNIVAKNEIFKQPHLDLLKVYVRDQHSSLGAEFNLIAIL